MALSESRGIYFPLGAAFFLGSMVQPRLDVKKKKNCVAKGMESIYPLLLPGS